MTHCLAVRNKSELLLQKNFDKQIYTELCTILISAFPILIS